MRATTELGHALGISVVAEGVETAAGWEQLTALGCDVVQGYYLARPLPAPDFLQFLADRAVIGTAALSEAAAPSRPARADHPVAAGHAAPDAR